MSDPRLAGPGDPAADPAKVADPSSTVSPADPAGTGSEAQGNIDAASTGEVSAVTKLDPIKDRAEAAQTQFPSLHGQSSVEVAERSADVARSASRKHRKIYRVFTDGLDFVDEAFDHSANFTAARQYMLDHGLRPTGDVAFVGASKYDDRNTDLTYEVEAIPAQVATDPAEANAVVSQD